MVLECKKPSARQQPLQIQEGLEPSAQKAFGMEDRVLVAVVLVVAMAAMGAWLLVRKINAKRAFEYRQSGRGKSLDD